MDENCGISYILLLLGLMGLVFTVYSFARASRSKKIPISVNYHLTRVCNYSCGFCFHTAKTSNIESLPNAKKGMALLKTSGMKKINFAGGEPFMKAEFLGQLARYCKETLKLESVSVVTNGSKVTSQWLTKYGRYLDIMAVSCDSFDEATNVKIGRGTGNHLRTVLNLSKMCKAHDILFKVNTVVNRYNFQEDMTAAIEIIDPFRWKCFQVLIVPEENGSEHTLRDARSFVINDEEWRHFCNKHKHLRCFVPEGNDVMASSYLLLDENLCFLNKGVKKPSESILDVGVAKALEDVYWDEESFHKRGGIYQWSKREGLGNPGKNELEW